VDQICQESFFFIRPTQGKTFFYISVFHHTNTFRKVRVAAYGLNIYVTKQPFLDTFGNIYITVLSMHGEKGWGFSHLKAIIDNRCSVHSDVY